LEFVLGIEVAHSPQGMLLCQCKHALEILQKYGLVGAKPVEFLFEEDHRLALANGPLLKNTA